MDEEADVDAFFEQEMRKMMPADEDPDGEFAGFSGESESEGDSDGAGGEDGEEDADDAAMDGAEDQKDHEESSEGDGEKDEAIEDGGLSDDDDEDGVEEDARGLEGLDAKTRAKVQRVRSWVKSSGGSMFASADDFADVLGSDSEGGGASEDED